MVVGCETKINQTIQPTRPLGVEILAIAVFVVVISPSRAGSLRGNLRGCAGTGSPTIHWRHFEPPFGQKNAPARCASLRCKPSAAAG